MDKERTSDEAISAIGALTGVEIALTPYRDLFLGGLRLGMFVSKAAEHALCDLLIEKGLITKEEWEEKFSTQLNREFAAYKASLEREFGTDCREKVFPAMVEAKNKAVALERLLERK